MNLDAAWIGEVDDSGPFGSASVGKIVGTKRRVLASN